MARRYYTTEIQDDEAMITGPDAAHLARVLRAKPGETLVLCDGAKTDYDAVIETITPEQVLLRVAGKRPSETEPGLWVEMYLGYSKGDKLEYAIQKCVELGASRIQPFFSEKSVVKPKKEEAKAERYNRIAAEAAKQCGRGILPVVEVAVGYKEAITRAVECDRALFLYEGGGEALARVTPQTGSLAIITGPEGGFTPGEAAYAGQAGCITVGLGPRILRCETAPLAALAAVMSHSGNME